MVKYVYDAWGNHAVLDADGNDIEDANHIGNLNPFRYRGYYYDVETGLYFLQTRYYDPETGRFISQDSLDYADPETVNGLNLYAYCGNNPVMNIDPTGTFFLACVIAGLIIGAVVGGVIGGVTAAQNGATGWELVGAIFCGAIVGGVFGAVAGAFIGVGGAMIGSGLGMIGGAGGFAALVGGGVVAAGAAAGLGAVVLGGIVVGGGIAIAGLGVHVLLSEPYWDPNKWPGDDPTVPPGEGFVWRGNGPKGSDKGAWVNPETGDSLHPDLHHPAGINPHWDYVNRVLKIFIRIFKP